MSTYTPIATQTLGSAAASVTFSSIPQGYTDLVLVVSGSGSIGNDVRLQFNSDTGSNYSYTTLSGTGSSAVSARATNETSTPLTYYGGISTTLGATNQIGYLMNYSNSTTFKSVLARANNASSGVDANVCLWRNTNAINTIRVFPPTANFQTGTTVSLYGIQVGDKAQKAQGGNIVTSDGTYVYHTFTSSGSFIPSEALTVDYLVVAGGGGGGGRGGGGAGAGGYLTASSYSTTANTGYTVTVGGGGTAGTGIDPNTNGTIGNNSVFATITSTGGGLGGGTNGENGGAGGSGGGGGAQSGAGGAASPAGQGSAGGAGSSTPRAGGGGGKSAVGNSGSANGNGGAGLAWYDGIVYAGGGGGGCWDNLAAGAGGAGGGGAGGTNNVTGTAGTANRGGGGGGGGHVGTGGNGSAGGAGGSGIVIIRYAI
jgi:hypothetical protein